MIQELYVLRQSTIEKPLIGTPLFHAFPSFQDEGYQ